jgi:hypothetical protein
MGWTYRLDGETASICKSLVGNLLESGHLEGQEGAERVILKRILSLDSVTS